MDNIYTKKVNYLFESIQTESEVKESEGRSIINSILNEFRFAHYRPRIWLETLPAVR